MPYTLCRPRPQQPLDFGTLQEAMARAGHPDPADWLPDTGMPGWPGWPDRIVTESMADGPAIEAIDVAHELIGLLPVGACATRVWSDADPAIAYAVWTALPSPFLVSVAVAARLSAHYAVAGILSWTAIADTVAAAFGDGAAGHASDTGPIITEVIAALAAEGIPVLPTSVSAAPVLRSAPWRPGTAWLSSDGAPAACVQVRFLDLKAARRVVRAGRAPSSPVTRWFDVALDRFLTGLDKAVAPLTASNAWGHRIMRPAWTITIPGGKLPAKWCTRLSRLLSDVLPMAICCAGIFGAWHAVRSTAVWGGAWQGAWPGITLWVIIWWLVSLIPEKLLGFRLRPAAPWLLIVPDEIQLLLRLAQRRHPWPSSWPLTDPAAPGPLAAALLRLALQGRRADLSVRPPTIPGHRRQLPPGSGPHPPADGQQ